MSLSQENDKRQIPELQRNMEILKEISFFEGFPTEVLKLLAYLCERGEYEEGDILFEKGDDPGIAYYILSGSTMLYRDGSEGEEKLRGYSAGEFICGFSLLGPMPALFTLRAETRLEMLSLTREQFSKVLEQYVELNSLLRKGMLKQLRRWEQVNIEGLDTCCLQKVGVTLL